MAQNSFFDHVKQVSERANGSVPRFQTWCSCNVLVVCLLPGTSFLKLELKGVYALCGFSAGKIMIVVADLARLEVPPS